MGSKSKVRSMQRGANKRPVRPISKEPDYENLKPSIRAEDHVHLGLSEAASEKIKTVLKEKIYGYARAGFRKPADVSRLLNKDGFRTAVGAEWNPRITYFLLGRIFGEKQKAAKPSNSLLKIKKPELNSRLTGKFPEKRKAVIATALPSFSSPSKSVSILQNAPKAPLTAEELEARRKALQNHLRVR